LWQAQLVTAAIVLALSVVLVLWLAREVLDRIIWLIASRHDD
jgi:hypothetical protein